MIDASAKDFRRTSVSAADFASAAMTVSRHDIQSVHALEPNWIDCRTYLEWARRGLAEADAYGLSNCIRYAKLAVARRIDALLRNNHVPPSRYGTYPDRMEALGRLGFHAPRVLHELAIDPRNDLEHRYSRPSSKDARRAVEVAELFVSATDPDEEVGAVIMVNSNLLGGHRHS